MSGWPDANFGYSAGQLLPERRAEITALGRLPLVSGTLSTLTSVAIVGLLTP